MDCPCHRTWLFYFHNILKIQTFYLFSLMGSMIGAFYELFLWNFKKTSTVSYGAALFFSCLGRFGCRRTGIFRPGENVALPSMPTCFIFFYYDDICSLSALAAMRPLLSRKDLDQPALSRPPRVFVLSFLPFGRCRAVFACMRLKTTEFLCLLYRM